MNPRLLELLPDGIRFDIVLNSVLLRIIRRHYPNHQRIVCIDSVRQPMGARREEGGMRIRAYGADLFHKAAERIERHPTAAYRTLPFSSTGALQDGVEGRAVRRRRRDESGLPGA